MEILSDINFKALIFGSAISAGLIILGFTYGDWLYPFSAIGLLYAGYGQGDIKLGTLMGAVASIPLIILFTQGYFGQLTGFFITGTGMLASSVLIIVVGAFVGLVGGWAKRNRTKALEDYKKKQKIGKNKTKKKKQKK